MNTASITTAISKVSTETDRPAMLLVEADSENESNHTRTTLSDYARRRFPPAARIRRVNDLSSVLKTLYREKSDVVLMDSRLPTIDAAWLINTITDKFCDAAIVAVGWEDDAQGREWILRGADDFVLAHELSTGRIDAIIAKVFRARRLRRENAHMLEQLRHSGREFDHFVRALSHDMMANFMLLESSFSQLRDSPAATADDETQNMFAHADACLAESKHFLDDLVQLAKTGSVEMEPEEAGLDELVSEVIFEQGELLVQGGIEVEVEAHLPGVWCNRQRVKQVVTNLVRNAIKHGCDLANPRIAVSAAGRGERVLLRIHDNGAGIESRMHKEIFLPGRRLPTASEEGSGMGLAIVLKIAERYGGSAWVDASTTFGTAFIVSLPAVPSSTPAPASTASDDDRQTPSDRATTADLHQPHYRPATKHR